MYPRDFSDYLRKLLRDGVDLDRALADLRGRGASIIESIVAVKRVHTSDLAEAKRLVHLSPVWSDVKAQDEDLWAELEHASDERGAGDGT